MGWMPFVQGERIAFRTSVPWWRRRTRSSKCRFIHNSTTWRGCYPENILLSLVTVKLWIIYRNSSSSSIFPVRLPLYNCCWEGCFICTSVQVCRLLAGKTQQHTWVANSSENHVHGNKICKITLACTRIFQYFTDTKSGGWLVSISFSYSDILRFSSLKTDGTVWLRKFVTFNTPHRQMQA
jgi:hypothetical protein